MSSKSPLSSHTRITPEKVGRAATKVAAEAAFVLTGMADVVAGTVQDVVKQGRAGYTERKAAGEAPIASQVRQVPGRVRGLVGEVKEAYRNLSARGRTVISEGFSSTAHRDQPTAQQAAPGDYEQPPSN